PPALQSYTASVESELSILARRAEGTEGAISIEQTRSVVRWERNGDFEQHVVGYRSQALGLSISTLSFIRSAWAVPVLFGNRITLLFGRDTSFRRPGKPRPTMVAVHPLAEDRDRVYRFSGGDTVVTMRVAGRDIPIIRIVVTPRGDAPKETVAFTGELHIDATRHYLVRMRGHFVTVGRRRGVMGRAMSLGSLQSVAYVELENAEFDGKYWLPSYQRIEAQAGWTALSDGRSIFRIISRFRDLRVNQEPNDVTSASIDLSAAASEHLVDTMSIHPHRLTLASSDSLARSGGWRKELGGATSDVSSDDFNDVAPDIWRPTGGPRFGWRAQRLMDLVRFNRVEGLYTGVAAELRLRDAAPGLSIRGNAGWAWQEATARGRVAAEWRRSVVTWTARAGRTLDITNDFRSPFDSGATIGPLIAGTDPYDYVDRRSINIGFVRILGVRQQARLHFETGATADRTATRHVRQGLFKSDSGFRDNRGVQPGNYWRNWIALEWHPDVSAEFLRTGIGATLSAENGMGELNYTRIEGRLMARRNAGAWTFAARGDGGTLLGKNPPPQQLFEIGSEQNLPGYGEKEFAGTRAAVARTLVMYRLPLLRAPLRIGRFVLPAAAPALAGGVQSGWTSVGGGGGAAALRALGEVHATDGTLRPVSRPTDGVRTSITLGWRFFGGALGVGAARPVDHHAAWRVVLDLAQII
ncbi:MAG: hypothetical protein ABIT38_16740, partial [Gemmatimonadaceae bacterium]